MKLRYRMASTILIPPFYQSTKTDFPIASSLLSSYPQIRRFINRLFKIIPVSGEIAFLIASSRKAIKKYPKVYLP